MGEVDSFQNHLRKPGSLLLKLSEVDTGQGILVHNQHSQLLDRYLPILLQFLVLGHEVRDELQVCSVEHLVDLAQFRRCTQDGVETGV